MTLSSGKTASYFRSALASVLIAAAGLAADSLYPPLVNWSAPATWSPHSASRGVSTMSDITNPSPLIGVTPCRQYDSRTPPTPLPTATNRTVTLTGAPCGIPTTAVAVSLNITVFNITGATGNGVFLVGTSGTPTTAWINYPPTETQRGNAGALPTSSGAIVVRVEQGAGSVDFTVDVNGYYTGGALNAGEALILSGSVPGNGTIVGINHSATGSGTSGVFAQVDGVGNAGSAVIGLQVSTTGLNFGVVGANISATNGATGVYGVESGTTGYNYGVVGATGSVASGSAGVLGYNGSGRLAGNSANFFSAGVRGESTLEFGVIGIVNTSSIFAGTAGYLTTIIGTISAGGNLGSNFGVAADATGPPWGVFAFGNLGASGTKHFVEPHPSDPKKVILYSSLEGREVGTYFRGTARVVNHQAVIEIPEDFRIVTDDEGLTVQLTPVGDLATLAVISQDLNHIVVKASRDVTFHYLVQGVRRAFKDLEPVRIGYEFMPQSPTDPMQPYLTEEAKRRLIANGTYNSDGTVNMSTAEQAGWTKIWANRQAEAEAAARRAAQQKAQPAGFNRP